MLSKQRLRWFKCVSGPEELVVDLGEGGGGRGEADDIESLAWDVYHC